MTLCLLRCFFLKSSPFFIADTSNEWRKIGTWIAQLSSHAICTLWTWLLAEDLVDFFLSNTIFSPYHFGINSNWIYLECANYVRFFPYRICLLCQIHTSVLCAKWTDSGRFGQHSQNQRNSVQYSITTSVESVIHSLCSHVFFPTSHFDKQITYKIRVYHVELNY